ncbi:MAG: hypothetical protein LBQ28_06590, partial [Prevotellaceae bacterium]|nr:hypothetical protein [Prevotellaceae bacterium]
MLKGIKFRGFLFSHDDFIAHLGDCPVCGGKESLMRKYYATINKDLNIHYLQCENCFAISASHYVKSNV